MTRRVRYSLLAIPALLLLALLFLLHTAWGLALILRITASFLPGELSIEEVKGSVSGPVMLGNINYRQGGLNVSVAALELDWQSSALFSGRLPIESLVIRQLDIDLPAASESGQKAPGRIVLPLAIEIGQAQVAGLKLQQHGATTPMIIDTIQLSATGKALAVHISDLQVSAYQTRLQSAGDISLAPGFPLNLQVEFSYTLPDAEPLHGKGSLRGDLRKLTLQQVLSGPLAAGIDAEVRDVDTELRWQAQVDIEDLNLATFNKSLPAVIIAGRLTPQGDLDEFSLDGSLTLEDMRMGRAQLSLAGQGDYQLKGYDFDVRGEFIGIDLPAAEVQFAGNGSRSEISLTRVQMNTLQGMVKGDARIAWQPKLMIQAELIASELDTAYFDRDWPGKLSARVSLKTTQREKATQISFVLDKMQGQLRDYPLAGSAQGYWTVNELALDKLELLLGDTRLHAQGRLDTQWDMRFSVMAPNINSLYPEAYGKLELSGRLRGLRNSPALQVQGGATQLHFAQYASEQLAITADVGLSAQDSLNLDLQLGSVTGPAGEWQSITLRANGTAAAHGVTLDAVNSQTTLHARIDSAVSAWQWQGMLNALALEQAGLGKWQLREPARFLLSQQTTSFSALCLDQATAYLCTELHWQTSQPRAMVQGRQIPLGMLNPWLPVNIRVQGAVDLDARLTGPDIAHLNTELTVTSASDAVHIEFVELAERLMLGASILQATLTDKGMQSRLEIPFTAGGGVDAQLELPGWTMADGLQRDQLVIARLTLDKLPADVISRFIPNLARAQGYVQADLSFNGTLGEPHMTGNADWHNGQMTIPDLGISITDIEAQVESARANTVKFSIQARSGEGTVRLHGQTLLEPAQGWPTSAKLTSDRLEVMNTAEAYVLVNSNVDITVQGNSIELGGDVIVPRARLRPRKLPEGTASLSRDVVIVDENDEALAPSRWLVTSRIRLQLGELVDFDGFEVNGKLRGNLLVIDEPGRPVVGQGELRIEEGGYRLRGQDLKIRRGRLIFANSFIDNPGIDVEATRSIEPVLVGVRIRGTLKQPTLTIFSEPAMAETDALSYLILGHAYGQGTTADGESMRNTAAAMGFVAGDLLARDIGGQLGLDELRVDVGETAQQTSLVMGKHLSSRLYVRYLTGIVESSNIVQLRYQLSPRVQIQTEGGYRGSQSVTGGDIFFTIQY